MAFSSFTSRLSKLDRIANVSQLGPETGGWVVPLTRHPLGNLASLVEVLLELQTGLLPSPREVTLFTYELDLCGLVVHGGRERDRYWVRIKR